jgi:hypothetical protein
MTYAMRANMKTDKVLGVLHLPRLRLVVISMALVFGLLAGSIASSGNKAYAATDSCTPPATTYGTDTLTMAVPTATTIPYG